MPKVSPGTGDLKLLAAAIALALLPAAAWGQEPDAREAQAAFERFRVARMPWSREPGSGPCDEIVGRFCYRHEAGSDRPPLAEAPEVADARDTLLARLDAAAGRDPADGWLAGQRVRYRIEAGRAAEAIAVAEGCRAEAWWCAALEGAARHAAGDFAGAEGAFDHALSSMPGAERERWTDLAPILDAGSRRVWSGLSRSGREAFARRLWWAADPLWSVPGNERRSEHLTRHAWDRMQEGAASAYDVSWGADLRELLVRYGWPAGWERARGDLGRLGGGSRPAVVARDPPGARRFVPTLAAIADPAVAGPADWSLVDPRPRSTYAPGYAVRFLAIEPQLAAFRRGTSAILVAGWALPPDSIRHDGSVAATLFAAEGPDRAFVEARGSATEAGGSLSLVVPWPRAVVSLEARGAETAGRWRAGVELPGARPGLPALSDLLLLASPDPLPATLEEAVSLARRSTVAAPGERLGVFWEAYPPEGADEALIAVSIRGRGQDPGALRWSEMFPQGVLAVPRAVALRLPALPPGDYVLEVEVAWPNAGSSRSRRDLAIRR